MNAITQRCTDSICANGGTRHKGQYRAKLGSKVIGIYIITNKLNGKKYIGQSVDIKRRFSDHRTISKETNIPLKHALIKYGKNAFDYSVLEECSIDMLNERERYWIKMLNPEYNLTSGGQDGLKKYPESVIKKISNASKRQWENMSETQKQHRITHNLKGRPKGHDVSEETRRKLRKANLGKKQTKETIEKRKQTILKKKQNGYVQTNSSHKKKVICVETKQIFNSVKEAGEYFGIKPKSVSSVLKGRQNTTKGYHFEYLKSVETIPDECKEVG